MDASGRPPTTLGRVHLPAHVVDLDSHELLRADGGPVDLRRQAVDLVVYLARRAGKVVSKQELLEEVWAGVVVTDDSLVQAVGDARRALGDDAHRVIQTVPRRGYRLVASAAASPAPPGSPPVDPAPTLRPRPRWPAAALAAVAACALMVWALWPTPRADLRQDAVLPDRPPLAVLDFGGTEIADAAHALARGFAEDLSNELARNVDLRVIASHSSFAVSGPREDLRRMAERLGARYLVDGTVRREAERLRLTVRLVDGLDARIVWSAMHDLPASEVYAVRDTIVRHIAASVHSTLRGNEEARAAQRPPKSLDVYEMTLRAIALKHRLSPSDSRDAKALLEQVVALDPEYAPGWLYLGFVNSLDTQHQLNGPYSVERMNVALTQLNRSLSLGSDLPAAHLALALSHLPLGRHDDAMASVRHCLDLSPSDAECLMLYATLLVRVAGEPAPALPYARAALEVNPFPPSYVVHQHGLVLWANGDLDAALRSLDESLRRAPNNLHARITRLVALTEAGRIDEARASLDAMRGTAALQMPPAQVASWTFGPRAKALIDRRLQALNRLGWQGSPSVPTSERR